MEAALILWFLSHQGERNVKQFIIPFPSAALGGFLGVRATGRRRSLFVWIASFLAMTRSDDKIDSPKA